MMHLPVIIRAARAADEPAILALVRSERLNPFDLDWRRFVLAIDSGGVVGAVQLREHDDGSRELGSLVVRRQARRHGVAARLIDALLALQRTRVFMITGTVFARHYVRWGFCRMEPMQAPWPILRNYWLGRLAGVQALLAGREPNALSVLQRQPAAAPWRSQGPWPAV
jgi:N-acetylglutamate synthase-like GNAT family acetyltransferase